MGRSLVELCFGYADESTLVFGIVPLPVGRVTTRSYLDETFMSPGLSGVGAFSPLSLL
jgi:hypothetical protein